MEKWHTRPNSGQGTYSTIWEIPDDDLIGIHWGPVISSSNALLLNLVGEI